MCHTPTGFAAIVAQPLLAPHVRLRLAFNLDFIWFVICPEGAVASADGAETFVGRFAQRWEGDSDGFAVACYAEVGLLGLL